MKRMNCRLATWVVLLATAAIPGSALLEAATPARGPLRVHPDNPRYFTDGTRLPDGSWRAVYLTGSHTWDNLVDMGRDDPPAPFDFDGYLAFLEKHHHNFIRLWAWDSTTWDTRANGALGKNFIHHAAPLPWARTGPGTALDGKPKFDLTRFNPAYFDRLRSRVMAAGERGIYVGVMLFEGWGLYHGNRRRGTEDGWAWRTHPFNPANNVNGPTVEGADALSGRVHTLRNPEVNALQAAYIRHVVDTLNDLDNVLYEVLNEGGEKEWNWWVIRTLHDHQRSKPKQHPVGNTGHGAERLASLLASPAEWVSPGRVDGFGEDPPAWNEAKVSLLDTDHIWGVGGNAAWVWKSFLRGHNPIFMDPYHGVVLGQDRGWEPVRAAMGHTRRWAERLPLAGFQPHNELASTGYCLARPGKAYLIYQPGTGAFTVELPAGSYRLEWFNPGTGQTAGTGSLQAPAGPRQFEPSTGGHSVLYLEVEPAGCLAAGSCLNAAAASRQVELYHWTDFRIEAPGTAAGAARWDVEGTCTWTHEDDVTRRISRVWYAGDGDTYVYRFGASLPGRWTGRTTSPIPALDGLEWTVDVIPSGNPHRTGWSGRLPGKPTAWARQQGPAGVLARRTPVLIMMPDVRHWHDDLPALKAFIATFNDGHGFNGGHLSTIGRDWFDLGGGGDLRTVPEVPDVRTFAALEAAAFEWSERGGWLHVWMWGKGSSGDFSRLPGGYDGPASRRLNRYLAARLGPVPGWSLGIGWDVEFWADEARIRWWLDDLVPQLGGWHHWIGLRYSDSDLGRGVDPEPANRGEYLPRGIGWNTLRSGDEQYAGWEHWASLTTDRAIEAGLQAVPDRPMMSEDRFRRRDGAWPQKDFAHDDEILREIPRWADRGVAAIYGRLLDRATQGSETWPNHAAIKAVIGSLRE